jgi:outer membrane protein TolC
MKGANMYRVRSATVLLFVMALALPAIAEELSLDAAVSAAFEASASLGAARAGVEAAAQGERSVGAEWMPSLGLVAGYGSYSGDVNFTRFLPGFPGGSIDVGPYDTNLVAALELKQLLYDGGAVGAARQNSAVERRIADEDLRRRQLDVEFEVTRTYFSALLAEERIEVADRGVERSREGLQMVRRRHAEQEALEVELLGVESQLAADELALLTAQHELDLTRRSLNRLLGRELDAELQLTGSLEQRTQLVAEQEGVQRAVAGNPVAQRARLGIEQADAMQGQASSLVRPKLDLRAMYTYIDNDLVFTGDYVGAVVSLSIPFVRDFRASSAAKGQAAARRRQAEQLVRDAESELRLRAVAAYRELEQSSAAIEVADRNLAFQRERYRVGLSAYREQLLTYSEVLEYHNELSEAELALSAARFGARIAEARIRQIVGEVAE